MHLCIGHLDMSLWWSFCGTKIVYCVFELHLVFFSILNYYFEF